MFFLYINLYKFSNILYIKRMLLKKFQKLLKFAKKFQRCKSIKSSWCHRKKKKKKRCNESSKEEILSPL